MKTIKNAIVVTRHAGLTEYLRQENIIDDTATVVSHATAEVVTAADVIGVLPHSLSCLTASFTEVPLNLPAEMRGVELTADDVRQYALEPATYSVNRI